MPLLSEPDDYMLHNESGKMNRTLTDCIVNWVRWNIPTPATTHQSSDK